jgi:hypothetical protein
MKNDAGSRVIIDIIFLRLATILSTPETRVLIVPEWTVMTSRLGDKRSYGGIVDYLITKRPTDVAGQGPLHCASLDESLTVFRYHPGSPGLYAPRAVLLVQHF